MYQTEDGISAIFDMTIFDIPAPITESYAAQLVEILENDVTLPINSLVNHSDFWSDKSSADTELKAKIKYDSKDREFLNLFTADRRYKDKIEYIQGSILYAARRMENELGPRELIHVPFQITGGVRIPSHNNYYYRYKCLFAILGHCKDSLAAAISAS